MANVDIRERLISRFSLWSPAFTAIGPDAVSLAWIVIDAGVPLPAGVCGIRLLRNGGRAGG